MNDKSIEKLELNKILAYCADYAGLQATKKLLLECKPSCDLDEVREKLNTTEEADKLLYKYGIGKIECFTDVTDLLIRASKKSTLTCGELLEVNALLRSARVAYTSVDKIADDEIVNFKGFANKLYFDKFLEDDIQSKIISVDKVSDFASDKLYSIRSRIKLLNERIRTTLYDYVTGETSKYLQDNIVTLRNDRYVIPVKAEYKNKVRGFVHDRSQSGSTFFIEPAYVLEMNNELISLTIDEKEEVDRILKELSSRVGLLSEKLCADMEVLAEMESYFARAEYCFNKKCTKPEVNKNGRINIIKGRHPLIDMDKVVPVSIELGKDYNFLLISGANTGGKTVTLKMSGLFCLMACCGLFIPAASGSSVAVFDEIYCDLGDSQSIEENLSTFSSHITTIKHICDKVNSNSLVLMDEPGGGTNPDEGQALAKAIVEYLLSKDCKGIVTTHYSSLKEYAYSVKGIENASMEFDSSTLKPLYSIKIGLPGASNALAISRRLGLREDILNKALSYLSEGSRNFENIVRRAEDSRVEAEAKLSEAMALQRTWQKKLNEVNDKIEKLNKEKEKISITARAEARRIIAEKTSRAEEILQEIEEIFKKEEISEAELIKVRTLKNKLKNTAYAEESRQEKVTDYKPANKDNIKEGLLVFVIPMQSSGKVLSVNKNKGEAEILVGSLKMHLAFNKLKIIGEEIKSTQSKVKVVKKVTPNAPVLEINVLGMTVEEAIYEVDNFIDKAVLDNLEEVKVIHGVGTGKLKNAIAQHLKRHKNVESFRLGKYGEGETGVTFIKLK
ncbi:MAG: endonuclease MutS2 [Clostridiales bacterium]|nr:endonuclease MutS2 [Clostridiales bacterium]